MKNNFIPNPRVPLYSQRHKDQIRLGFCVLAGLGLIGVCAIVWFFRSVA